MYGMFILDFNSSLFCLPGEFIVNAINKWLLPSMSEFKLLPTPSLLFVPYYEKETCIPHVVNNRLMHTKLSTAWSLNGFSTAYGFRMCPVTL